LEKREGARERLHWDDLWDVLAWRLGESHQLIIDVFLPNFDVNLCHLFSLRSDRNIIIALFRNVVMLDETCHVLIINANKPSVIEDTFGFGRYDHDFVGTTDDVFMTCSHHTDMHELNCISVCGHAQNNNCKYLYACSLVSSA
jgi:hypothetical protein